MAPTPTITPLIRTQAPGKLILLGEYAVLRGAPALVMAVDRYAHVYLESSRSNTFLLTAPDVGIRELPFSVGKQGTVAFTHDISVDPNAVAFVQSAVETVAATASLPPVRITISSAEFFYQNSTTKLGLGSSAAVAVSLIAALLHAAGIAQRDEDAFKLQVLEMALTAHRRAQGKQGSGVDIAASTFGGILEYTMPVVSTQLPPKIQALSLPPRLYMRFVWTRTAASTTRLIQQVSALRETSPGIYNQIFSELIYLSEQGCLAFHQQSVTSFLEIIRDYYRTLLQLSKASGAPIISPVHADIHSIAERHQVAYKPSGAGEGDFGILFAENELNLIDATVQLEKMGFPIFSFQIDERGVTINIERGD